MDVRDYVIGGLVLVVVVMAVLVFTDRGAEKSVVSNVPDVYYLYPSRCVNCNLNAPGECDFCNSYYDDRVMGTLGSDLGVSFKFVVSDAVDKPNLFAVNLGNAYLIDAKSKYIIANNICSVLSVNKSCDAFKDEIGRTRACIMRFGVSDDTLVYHYSNSSCIYCDKTTPVVDSLFNDVSYNETYPYKVRKANDKDSEDRKLLDGCFGSFINMDYVPQVICPKTGDSITGEIDKLSTLRNFADKCIEAK